MEVDIPHDGTSDVLRRGPLRETFIPLCELRPTDLSPNCDLEECDEREELHLLGGADVFEGSARRGEGIHRVATIDGHNLMDARGQ